MKDLDDGERYVRRWFWTLDQLAEAAGAVPSALLEMIEAGCAPGPIYVRGRDGTWWTALDESPPPCGNEYYSPGAAWGLRRALLGMRSGATAAAAAERERLAFVSEFVACISTIDGADIAFPGCFAGGSLDEAKASCQAEEEWKSWIDGGYGVCLRVFNAQTCLAKEALGARLKRALSEGSYDLAELLRQAEALAALMLPFAPWQRASCTPGLTIDRLLLQHHLGRELPYD